MVDPVAAWKSRKSELSLAAVDTKIAAEIDSLKAQAVAPEVEERADGDVVTLDSPFNFGQLAGELVVAAQELPELNKRAHYGDIHLDGAAAPQDAREHPCLAELVKTPLTVRTGSRSVHHLLKALQDRKLRSVGVIGDPLTCGGSVG